MRKIKELVCSIKEELHDAENYYTCALLAEGPDAKRIYTTLAREEIEHANKLHDLAVLEINTYKGKGAEVPEAMQAIWDYEHKEIILEVDRLKEKLSKM